MSFDFFLCLYRQVIFCSPETVKCFAGILLEGPLSVAIQSDLWAKEIKERKTKNDASPSTEFAASLCPQVREDWDLTQNMN